MKKFTQLYTVAVHFWRHTRATCFSLVQIDGTSYSYEPPWPQGFRRSEQKLPCNHTCMNQVTNTTSWNKKNKSLHQWLHLELAVILKDQWCRGSGPPGLSRLGAKLPPTCLCLSMLAFIGTWLAIGERVSEPEKPPKTRKRQNQNFRIAIVERSMFAWQTTNSVQSLRATMIGYIWVRNGTSIPIIDIKGYYDWNKVTLFHHHERIIYSV